MIKIAGAMYNLETATLNFSRDTELDQVSLTK